MKRFYTIFVIFYCMFGILTPAKLHGSTMRQRLTGLFNRQLRSAKNSFFDNFPGTGCAEKAKQKLIRARADTIRDNLLQKERERKQKKRLEQRKTKEIRLWQEQWDTYSSTRQFPQHLRMGLVKKVINEGKWLSKKSPLVELAESADEYKAGNISTKTFIEKVRQIDENVEKATQHLPLTQRFFATGTGTLSPEGFARRVKSL